MLFSERLRELRQNKGLSQSQLADALNISKSAISMYELGKREPDLETLEGIADFFNVDINYLIGKEDGSMYYLDPEAAEIAQEVQQRPELKLLFEVSRKASVDDLGLIISMIDRLKMYRSKFEESQQFKGAEDTFEYNSSTYEPETIAAHHEGDWTKEELEEVEEFKKYVKDKNKNK